MPSKHQRMALTVPPDLKTALEEYAAAAGKPVASIVVELLYGAKPQIEELTRIMRAISAGQVEVAKDAAQRMASKAATAMNTAQQELTGLDPDSSN